jgi:hypothetical protein
MSPALVTPYRKGNKTDRNDAEAILEAVTRPSMRFVMVKSVAQQDRSRCTGCGPSFASEAVVEQGLRVPCGEQGVLFRRQVAQISGRDRVAERDVSVTLHQPRHQRHAAGLDNLGAPAVKLATVARHSVDTPTFNQQVRGKSSFAAAVPNPAIPDDRLAHAVLPLLLDCSTPSAHHIGGGFRQASVLCSIDGLTKG